MRCRIPIIINGTVDYFHILCVMSKNIALARLIEEIKGILAGGLKRKEYIKNNLHGSADMPDFLLASRYTIKQSTISDIRKNDTKK